MSSLNVPSDYKPKVWLQRPEGKIGAIIAGLAGAGVLYLLLPFIVVLLQNAITAVVLAAVLLALLGIMPTLWRGYKFLNRKLLGLIIQLDALGILKEKKTNRQQKLEQIAEYIDRLKGAIRKLRNKIDASVAERDQNLRLAQEYKKQGNAGKFDAYAFKAGLLDGLIKNLQVAEVKSEGLYRGLLRMNEAGQNLVFKMNAQIDVLTAQYEAIKEAHRASSGVMSLFRGNSKEEEEFQMAMEFINDDYGQKFGEIESAMETADTILSSLDLEKGIYREDALRKIDAWEKQQSTLLGDATKRAVLAEAKDPAAVLDLDAPQQKGLTQAGGYEELFR
ncbi:MAG: hypothetical protein A2939_04210 [Parcubacteria group bacterium RIFCSPLOWO2_01_FULL_48_18]|nr:MAG: hypothetical protein A2939_04210 [Parcubacteria group bacterium RIFCSPLOWO2_01_FULL_48_18]